MASFNTHLSIGIAVSGVFATTAMITGLADRSLVIPLFLLGTLGSLMPDLDSDHSTPLQIAFTVLSILFAFLLMFTAALYFHTLAELLLVWGTAYLIFRWGVFHLFTRHTTHRGIIHSIPVAALFGSLTTSVAYWLFKLPPFDAWSAGIFVTLGFLTHLLLDEISAVNLFGLQSRKSFGTAMKLWYANSLRSTLAAYVLLVLSLPLLPPLNSLQDELGSMKFPADITDRLFPDDGWFKGG